MKIYISLDMEGIAGAHAWGDVSPSNPAYQQMRALMTQEALAACEGANHAGADEILLRDGYNHGDNILLEDLPSNVSVIRGWSGSPMEQIQDLNCSFDAAVFIGWHARAGSDASPLSHTVHPDMVEVRVNDQPISEFSHFAPLAAYVKVPVVFVSGDEAVCREARAYHPAIGTAAVSTGRGASTTSVAPARARLMIRDGVREALSRDPSLCYKPLPKHFKVEVAYAKPHLAYQYAWYPGAVQIAPNTIRFMTDDYFEVARFLMFVSKA